VKNHRLFFEKPMVFFFEKPWVFILETYGSFFLKPMVSDFQIVLFDSEKGAFSISKPMVFVFEKGVF
jgi:hypothetical protein